MTESVPPIRTWVVDDEDVFRETLCIGLQLFQDIFVTSYNSCDAALEALDGSGPKPNVVLLDFSMPGIGGFRGITEIRPRSVESKIIMLTVHDERDIVVGSIREGAFGFLQKSTGLDETVAAIRDAASGRRHFDPASLTIVINALLQPDERQAIADLSTRQKELVALFALGLKQGDVAKRLGLSLGTIKTQKRRLFRKLGVHNTPEAVKRSKEWGIL